MKRIAVFTGSRAEYGLLYWIIKRIHERDTSELQLLVGGMHLSPEFGMTVSQIENDGFPITDRLEFLLSSDSAVGIAKSMGLALIAAAESFSRNKPDLVVLLGDRFETMTVAQAAMVARIPIAHIHGGEATEGLIDEAVRHSITKMAHLHFTATETYRDRVIQLGERPEQVFNFGAPGIDSITRLNLLPRTALSEAVNFNINGKYFLVTYHPVTLEPDGAINSLESLLEALDKFPKHQIIITYPNADTHGRRLLKVLDDYQVKNSSRVKLSSSLGQLRYLSLMKYCDAVIGNSSSGLIEAPSFKVPTVNIGNRQQGRVCGDTVINTDEEYESIYLAISRALNPEFRDICAGSINPYGLGKASDRIVDVIERTHLESLIFKPFHDLKVSQ